MSNYLGEIIEITNKCIKTSEGKDIILDSYHLDLPFRKGDIVLQSGDKLLGMIPTDRKSVIESIKNPITGISPVFAKIIISESDNFIIRSKYSPETSMDKILSNFFNMIMWKEFYFSYRGKFLSAILNNNVPITDINKFIKYWLEEHFFRQFALWGLSQEQTKIIIEDFSIVETGDTDIEDIMVMISKYPGRFLYINRDVDFKKIEHLTQIFGAQKMPLSIRKLKKDLHDSKDSYIPFTGIRKKNLGKDLMSIGPYGLKTFDNDTKVSLISTYKIETSVCDNIARKVSKCNYNWRSQKINLRLKHDGLSEEQREGLSMAFMNPISIFTGGPGCGKTILVRALINEALARGIPYHVAAFTGKAVGRVKEAAYPDHIESSTIDMMLVQGPNHYKFNLLILEEASMITTKYIYRLFKKFNPLAYSIVIVGDLDQIPPIDKGQFFSSLIWSKRVPYIRLTKNFRVDSSIGGDIIRNAALIVDPMRDISKPIDIDIASKSFNVLKGNLGLIKSILKNFERSTLDKLTIMSPYNVEVSNINKIFQEIKYSEDDKYLPDKYVKWYEGDRIMIIENNLNEDVANGDLGTIMSIDFNHKKIEVRLDKDEVRRTFTTKTSSSLLKHSYCFTINKSQGSEYDCVILYLPINVMNDSTFLNMNMIYTAITRAKKMVWIVVEDPMILINACNRRLPVPNDVLKDHLKAKFPDKEYIGTLVEPIPCDMDDDDIYGGYSDDE